MNIPIELIAAIGAVLLGAILNNQRANRRRIERLEKSVLTIIVMLRDRGFKVPKSGDTDLFAKVDL
jgi:hypothetical protein